MNELDRVVATLVRNIESRFPQYLAAPFRIREIYEQIIPYRLYRRELGVDTNEYYEIALTRLLAGEGGYLLVPDDVRGKLRVELDSSNPDPSRCREFGEVDVKLTELAHDAAEQNAHVIPAAESASQSRRATPGKEPASSRTVAATPKVAPRQSPVTQQENEMPPSKRTTTAAAVGGTCRFCHGSLPEGRKFTYCPHCGQDLTVQHCPACSSELEVGWKFCVTCGRSVAES